MKRALLLGGVLTIGACGGGSGGGPSPATGGEPAGPPPTFAPVLTADALPELVRFVDLGETGMAELRARFTADNLYVTENLDASMGGDRELRVHARGPNTGHPVGYVQVTRRQRDGYVGELGDDYGSVRFSFARVAAGAEPVLVGVEISQPAEHPNDVCAPGATLATDAAALDGCPEASVYSPAAPTDGGYFLCVGDETGELAVTIHCARGSTRRVSYDVTIPIPPPPPTEAAIPAGTTEGG